MADRRPSILIPITRARSAAGLLEVAGAVLRGEDASGLLLGVVELPLGRPIAQSVTIARRYRSLLQRITELETQLQAEFGVQVRVAGSIAQGVREAAYESSADLVILEWPGPGAQRAYDRNIDDLVADPPADLLLVRHDPTGEGLQLHDGVLAPVRCGASARLALRAAAALIGADRVALTALHVHDPRYTDSRKQRDSEEFHELLHEFGRRRVEPVEVVSLDP